MKQKLIAVQQEDVQQCDNKQSIQSVIAKKLNITDCEMFKQFVNVQYLHIGYNKITQCQELQLLVNIEDLILCDNEITLLDFLQWLPKLKRFCASGNHITAFSLGYFQKCIMLQELTLFCPLGSKQNPLALQQDYRQLILFNCPGTLVLLDRKVIFDEERDLAFYTKLEPEFKPQFFKRRIIEVSREYHQLQQDINLFKQRIQKIQNKIVLDE